MFSRVSVLSDKVVSPELSAASDMRRSSLESGQSFARGAQIAVARSAAAGIISYGTLGGVVVSDRQAEPELIFELDNPVELWSGWGTVFWTCPLEV